MVQAHPPLYCGCGQVCAVRGVGRPAWKPLSKTPTRHVAWVWGPSHEPAERICY